MEISYVIFDYLPLWHVLCQYGYVIAREKLPFNLNVTNHISMAVNIFLLSCMKSVAIFKILG